MLECYKEKQAVNGGAKRKNRVEEPKTIFEDYNALPSKA